MANQRHAGTMNRNDKPPCRRSPKTQTGARDDRATQILAAIVESSDAAIIGKTLDGIVTSWISERQTDLRLYRVRDDRSADPRHRCAGQWIDQAALGALHTGLISWAFLPGFHPIGLLLPLGATLNLWRLLHWRGGATAAEPLLLILHLGYAWVVLGAALLGLSMLDADLPQSAAIHTLTAGAMATTILR